MTLQDPQDKIQFGESGHCVDVRDHGTERELQLQSAQGGSSCNSHVCKTLCLSSQQSSDESIRTLQRSETANHRQSNGNTYNAAVDHSRFPMIAQAGAHIYVGVGKGSWLLRVVGA